MKNFRLLGYLWFFSLWMFLFLTTEGCYATNGRIGSSPADTAVGKKVVYPPPNLNVLTNGVVGLVANNGKANNGYTLFAPIHSTNTYLINIEGQVVNRWTLSEYLPGQSVSLLENGHLLRCCYVKDKDLLGRSGGSGRLEEYDWEGNLIWEFDYADENHLLHHDIEVLPNGNILALAVERKTYDEAIAAGFDPQKLGDKDLYVDHLIEIKPIRPRGGKIVWEWHVWDHLVQDRDQSKQNFGNVADNPGRIDVNVNKGSIDSFWNHINSVSHHPERDEVLLSVRNCSEIWIIDHSTSTTEAAKSTGGRRRHGGELLYRWGNPEAYKQGARQDQRLFEQHDARWIPEGLPGAGHVLVFNNGMSRGYSSVLEIEPVIDAQGGYTKAAGLPFGPAEDLWRYPATQEDSFFSVRLSGAQRLPNGNTLICFGTAGLFFEVSSAGDVVWAYVNPVVRGGVLAQGELPGVDPLGHLSNAVFNAHRYSSDYLTGLQQSPRSQGRLERPAELRGRTGLDRRSGPQNKPLGSVGDGHALAPDSIDIIKELGYL